MKIIDAKVIVCSPGRNFVTLKVTTDEGIYGLGDATLNGREKAVVAYLEEYVIPCIMGKDPFNSESIWNYLYKGAYWKRGPVTMSAIAAVDMAMWDIKAKALNVPLYKLLGGKNREKVFVYCHATGKDIDSALVDVEAHMKLGYKAIRVQSGIPGVAQTYGVTKGEKNYEPAKRGGVPTEEVFSVQKYLNYMPKLFAKVRNEFGDDIELLHDAHHRLTPNEAARLGKELEPYHLFWLEDPIAEELQEGFKHIRQHTTTPIAVGEIFNTIYDCHQLIVNQWIDYLRMTIVHGGGITPLVKTAHLAELYNVKTGFHGATDLSPVTMAAAIHFNLAIQNFGIQEHMPHSDLAYEVFNVNYEFKDGYLTIDDTPGLGVTMNEENIDKYPYTKGFLPVARLEDGTYINW